MLGRKVIYVRCIRCSYNNVAKSIGLLDKKAILVYRKILMQVGAFERYIPLKCSRGASSIIGDGILSKFKPIQNFIVVLLICKDEEDILKIESTRVVTTFLRI